MNHCELWCTISYYVGNYWTSVKWYVWKCDDFFLGKKTFYFVFLNFELDYTSEINNSITEYIQLYLFKKFCCLDIVKISLRPWYVGNTVSCKICKVSNIQSLLDLDGLPNMSCQDVVGWVSLCGRLSNDNTLANESNWLNLPYAGKGKVKNSYYYSASSQAPYWRNRVMKMTKMHMLIPPSPSSISLLDIHCDKHRSWSWCRYLIITMLWNQRHI